MKNQIIVKNSTVRVNRLHDTLTDVIMETINSKNFLRKCAAYCGDSSPKYWKLSSYWDDAKNWLK